MARKPKAELEGASHAKSHSVGEEQTAEETAPVEDKDQEDQVKTVEPVKESVTDTVEVVSTIQGRIRSVDGSKFGKGEVGHLTLMDANMREAAGQVKLVK